MTTSAAEQVITGFHKPVRPLCFHCGLQVPVSEVIPQIVVFGDKREFCCYGCHAICSTILDAGLDEYYQHRTDQAVSASQPVPDFLNHIELFDKPDIQKDFVRHTGDSREAALLLDNIRCPACLWLNERHLRNLPGVLDVSIDDTTQRARVRWNPEAIQLSEILRAITDIGYMAYPYDASRSEQLNRQRRQRSTERLIFAGAIGMLVMNFSLATYFLADSESAAGLPLWNVVGRWTSLFLALLLLAYPGQAFFAGAWNDLRHRRLGMDIPVVLGLSAAFIGSLHATVTGQGAVYFDSIAMFIFFLLLARRWELRGKLRAADRLDRLARITPRTATRQDAEGKLSKVPVAELQVGDLIRLLPGENLPVDGTLVVGVSSFDESLLTGEAHPVVRQPGDGVVAGSVNNDQSVVISVTHSVQHSTVSKIQKLVEHGLEIRPHSAVLAEQVARWFVAVLLLIALATAIYWLRTEPGNWLPSTIAVLIVTCPCALALATPVALTVSAGRFIDQRVLPLRMRALDALACSDLFVFDKTGSLTTGKPTIAAVIPTDGLNKASCLHYAAALAVESAHPVAHALHSVDPQLCPVATQVENVVGAGIRALIDGQEWRFGKPEFAANTTSYTESARTIIAKGSADGQLVSVLANSAGVQSIMLFEDPLRPDVDAMLSSLKGSGVRHFAILSGDSPDSVVNLGKQLGIETALGGLSPADKLAWLQKQQALGHKLVMFGDGINDAPSLAAADVSISFADATDMANNSSDFLILGNDLTSLADARQLARQTRRNILQNFTWAAAYNLLAVPFAAAGWIPPWGAAIGMSFSSLFVVMNALRLQRD